MIGEDMLKYTCTQAENFFSVNIFCFQVQTQQHICKTHTLCIKSTLFFLYSGN